MGIRFIIGRAGSGKSRRAFDAIVDEMRRDPLGPAIFWILPRQLTFSAERELTCASGLNGFCRTRVLSFDELGREVLADCGGAAAPPVTELGRQMILGLLLRRHEAELRYFRSAARQSGLAAELDATFAEMERCGKTPTDLRAILADIESSVSKDDHDQALVAKLHDLQHLYEAYLKYIGQDRLDPYRRIAQVLECIQNWNRTRDATAYVDGFLDFTDYERQIIASLAKVCRSVEVSLMFDPLSPILDDPHKLPDELNPFHRTELAYRKLWFALAEAGIEPDSPIRLDQARRFEAPSLLHLEQSLLARGTRATADHAGIALIEAPDRRAEVDAAARQIRAWVRSGRRYRDIAVLARDLGEYQELIDASFREHDIPHFIDRRRTAAHHPLIQFTRAVLLLVIHNWPADAVMTLAKSGLGGLSLEESDTLENYVLLHRIGGGGVWTRKEPWRFRRDLTTGVESEIHHPEIEDLDRIDRLRRRIVDGVAPLASAVSAEAVPIRDIVHQLVRLFERFDVRATMARWLQEAAAADQIEQHDEHLQVWTNLMDLLDQMVDLLGDEPATAVQFLEILDFGLERFDLALTPPTIDQVLVGNVDRTRNPQSKAVVLLGLNDGQFPRSGREDSIFSDGERRWLTDRRVDLERDARRKLFDETLLAYIGCTRASEELTFCRALADPQQRPQSPSVIWRRVREIFPGLVPVRLPREMDAAPQCIGTPRQLVTQLMRWARTKPDGIEPRDSPWPALFHWLATRDYQGDALDLMRGRAWRALSYDNSARLSPDVSARLLHSPLRASVSRLETYASCPFKHFARYVLDLERREDPDVTAIDLGNVYHEVLEQIVSRMVEARQGWNDVPPERRTAAIKSCVASVGQSLRGELMLSTARNRYLLQRIEQTLSLVIAAHEAAARRNRLRPLATELSFGFSGAGLPAHAITTPRGRVVELRGKIDRVDVLEDEHAFAVIDYKLSGDSLELDRVYHGLALQLLTYLLVLQAAGDELFGRPLTPAAAFYVKLMRKLATRNHPDDATDPGDPLFDLDEVPRGIFDAAYFGALDTATGQGRSASVKAHIKRDGNFGDQNRSDAADAGEFAGLLKLVQRRVGELADRILDGDISITPYRLKSQSPCQRCEFLAVCRFDTQFNSYHALDSMTRTQVLKQVTQEKQRGAR